MRRAFDRAETAFRRGPALYRARAATPAGRRWRQRLHAYSLRRMQDGGTGRSSHHLHSTNRLGVAAMPAYTRTMCQTSDASPLGA